MAVGARARGWLRKEWFLVALFGAVLLASLWPELGASQGLLRLDGASDVGVALIFLLTGLGLSTAEVGRGLANWRVHALVQLATFVMFPLLGVALVGATRAWWPDGLLLGIAYLCALPSTISSSVAMTVIARGNVPAAVFNATLSSLLGIVATPALLALTAHAGGATLEFMPSVIKLGRMVLLPLLVGQALRPWLGDWLARHKARMSLVDRAVILMFVLNAFSDSVRSGLWRDHGAALLAEALAAAAVLLAIGLVLTTWAARRASLSTADEIAVVFCGSKKTLAAGIPMARVLFGANPQLGVIVLPIMFYHQIQLIACSVLAGRYARRP
ncbi:MAG: bile acid:sodium symporter [Pelomonas sp.]|nr:bile acid:sodium symporter [Roseateles sp.]